MEETIALNNQKWLDQCKRIKMLMSKAAKTKVGKNMYGAKYHKYSELSQKSVKDR
jgi:hypothetical protein